jgi:ABC-type uncharacterized transport system permease subunit
MPNVSPGQLALVLAAAALFAAAAGLSLLRARAAWEASAAVRVAAKATGQVGFLAGLAVLVWHSAGRQTWLPLGDNFDTLACLGVLLAGFVLYVQAYRPLRGLDWFLLPVVSLLLAAAAVFGRTKPHEYVDTTWSWVHRVTAYGGAVAFAVAGAAGLMYLIANRRLRSKATKLAGPGANLGSLERLERLTLSAVGLGFALLTIGAVTGLARIAQVQGDTTLGERWFLNPKVLLALGVWVVYAVVLHSPINPSFRGRKAAVLSVVGFVLMIGTVVAVQFVPTAR